MADLGNPPLPVRQPQLGRRESLAKFGLTAGPPVGLGATALSAFPMMVAELNGSETVLTGVLEDQSAIFGVLAQIEALGLELLELRQVAPDHRGPDRA
jgi:hypothetical protein